MSFFYLRIPAFFLLFSSFSLLLAPCQAQSYALPGPGGSGAFGTSVMVLANGNYVISDPSWDGSASDAGAVYLYDGGSHALISALTGSSPGDQVGSGGIFPLANGNFVVASPRWDNGGSANAGAATWVSGSAGLNASVSAANSLVGTAENDEVGRDVYALSNGNCLILSPGWSNAGTANAGAVSWMNGLTGGSGTVSAANSLVGSSLGDQVGSGGIFELSNGNYVVSSPEWDNGGDADAGAATWGNGAAGLSGAISAANSLVGSQAGDQVSNFGIYPLSNGNYVVSSPDWDNGTILNAGAATWGSGTAGVSGAASAGNSLVGASDEDAIGSYGISPLTNGNYVVASPFWDNGGTLDVGAATWANGTTGLTGAVSVANSLTGSQADDQVSLGGIFALTNGNYVVCSPFWDNGGTLDVGAATWANGSTGLSGAVSGSNSLRGSQVGDEVGSFGVTALSNGNYVVSSPYWDNGGTADAGAATWANGSSGIAGAVSAANSFTSTQVGSEIGSGGIVALTNGNYVVSSPFRDRGAAIDAGAVTWCDGSAGRIGNIANNNSLTGNKSDNLVGIGGIVPLSNGNYVVLSPFWGNGALVSAGALTWRDGSAANGNATVSATTSLVGSSSDDLLGIGGVEALSNGNYVAISPFWDNGLSFDAGALTWVNGAAGLSGALSASNSLVGGSTGDYLGLGGIRSFADGNFFVSSPDWDNGGSSDAGAVAWGNGSLRFAGAVGSCNSSLGASADGGGTQSGGYNPFYGYFLAGQPADNQVLRFEPLGQALVTADAALSLSLAGANPVPFVLPASCELICALQAGGASPVSGTVGTEVWIEAAQPADFVKRHYEVAPSVNPASATGTLTLYFTQAEFNDYNAVSASPLPSGPGDAAGIASLRILRYAGSSSDGSGLPASYSGGSSLLDPADGDIRWNAEAARWEVKVPLAGAGGFFAQAAAVAFPVELLSFSGQAEDGIHQLEWTTAVEVNTAGFFVERGADGQHFEALGFVAGSGNSSQPLDYAFPDAEPLRGPNYYRLRIRDLGGAESYSRILTLRFEPGSQARIYPNPASTFLRVSMPAAEAPYELRNALGQLLREGEVASGGSIDIGSLPPGMYYLRLGQERKSFVKE
jgi:hypothetical protein